MKVQLDHRIYIPPFIFVFPLLFLGSCKMRENIVYWNNSQIDSTTRANDFMLKLKVDDILSVSISDLDNETVALFNTQENAKNSEDKGYLINMDGHISIPVLGKVKVVDLTISEAEQAIVDKLKEYLKHPTVQVRIVNFKVTILGEVNNPGTFVVKSQRISILDALGLAGDLSIKGVRKNVLVLREKNGRNEEYRLDLTSKSILSSPAFYLQQNDVVYVEPNVSAQLGSKVFEPNAQFILTSFTSLFTILILLVR